MGILPFPIPQADMPFIPRPNEQHTSTRCHSKQPQTTNDSSQMQHWKFWRVFPVGWVAPEPGPCRGWGSHPSQHQGVMAPSEPTPFQSWERKIREKKLISFALEWIISYSSCPTTKHFCWLKQHESNSNWTGKKKKEFASGRFVFSNASTSTLIQERKKQKKKCLTGNVEGLSLSFATLT